MKYMICIDESETVSRKVPSSRMNDISYSPFQFVNQADTAFEWLLDVVRSDRDEVHLFCAIEPQYAYASMGTPGHETYVDKALYVHQKKVEVLLEKFLKRLAESGVTYQPSHHPFT